VVAAVLALALGAAAAAPVGGAAEPVTLWSLDFEDGGWAPWFQSGGPALSVVDADGDKALRVGNRANDFDGIQSPTGALAPDVEYRLSMQVRLETAGTADVRFVVKPSFTWVGNTTVSASSWTTVSGTFTAPAGTDPATLQVYIGSGPHSSGAGSYTYLVDDLRVTTVPADPPPPAGIVLATDFESGLGGWVPRGDAQGNPTVAVTETEAHGGVRAALVSDRTSQGDGIGRDVTGLMVPGVTYEIDAWVKLAAGGGSGEIWLSMQRVNGGSSSFDTVAQAPGVTDGEWRRITATYRMSSADTAFLYFETRWPDGTSASFLLDDVVVEAQGEPEIEDLTPIKDRLPFAMGVAVDSRETAGTAAELTVRHFDQLTPENHMKPEAWYDAARAFRIHPEATAIMDFAQARGLKVYGHTLVWHSQTPAWFFTREDGTPLTGGPADQQLLRDRLRTHVFAVAAALSTAYGPFGSATNPLVAFDVVNEVVSDAATSDGLRRSRWYEVLGESYVELAFRYADEAFNGTYAAPGSGRPVRLAINDYNTEQEAKRQRLRALVTRLLASGAPVDLVGHQFHVSLSTPVESLDDALADFAGLPVKQVVSELDVTTGTPVTEARLIDQGYFYRDAFRVFRAHAASLFSVTVWGLTDGRSWRVGSGAPLVFGDDLKAKPAYFGIVDGELPPRQRSAFVFMAGGPLGAGAHEWKRLPLHALDGAGAFQLRWRADTLVALVRASDATREAADGIAFVVDGTTSTVARDGTGTVPAEVAETAGGWTAVAELPLPGAAAGALVQLDVRVTDGATTVGWNEQGATGTLTLVEPVSFTEAAEAPAAPEIDGAIDGAWVLANAVTTDVPVLGATGATARVRTLWREHTLYVLAEVADDTPDVSGSDPWIQDSLEIFLDAGNVKNGPYRFDDTQIRISRENVTSFGTGDVAFQAARLRSATAPADGGYVVEASVSLLEHGGPGTFHGLDFQVNDGAGGARIAIRNWADPTGLGYQSTSRWGVVELVAADARDAIGRTIASLRELGAPSPHLERAVEELDGALLPALWADGLHPRAVKGGGDAPARLFRAVQALEKHARRGTDMPVVAEALGDVAAVARLLAVVAAEDAPAAKRRDQALARIAQGDADAASGRFADAVKRYGQAWALVT
jgi:endo-1,4-beta-xylanase